MKIIVQNNFISMKTLANSIEKYILKRIVAEKDVINNFEALETNEFERDIYNVSFF